MQPKCTKEDSIAFRLTKCKQELIKIQAEIKRLESISECCFCFANDEEFPTKWFIESDGMTFCVDCFDETR